MRPSTRTLILALMATLQAYAQSPTDIANALTSALAPLHSRLYPVTETADRGKQLSDHVIPYMEFFGKLSKKTGQKANTGDYALAAYTQGSVPESRLQEYVQRADELSKDLVRAWRKPLNKFTKSEIPLLDLSLNIVMEDGLWEGRAWKPGNPEMAIKRIASMDRATLDSWFSWRGLKSNEVLIVFSANSLAGIDVLFEGERFKKDAYQSALPLLKDQVAFSKSSMKRLRDLHDAMGGRSSPTRLQTEQETQAFKLFQANAKEYISTDEVAGVGLQLLKSSIPGKDLSVVRSAAESYARSRRALLILDGETDVKLAAMLSAGQQKRLSGEWSLRPLVLLAGPGFCEMAWMTDAIRLNGKGEEIASTLRPRLQEITAEIDRVRRLAAESFPAPDTRFIDSLEEFSRLYAKFEVEASVAASEYYGLFSDSQRRAYHGALKRDRTCREVLGRTLVK